MGGSPTEDGVVAWGGADWIFDQAEWEGEGEGCQDGPGTGWPLEATFRRCCFPFWCCWNEATGKEQSHASQRILVASFRGIALGVMCRIDRDIWKRKESVESKVLAAHVAFNHEVPQAHMAVRPAARDPRNLPRVQSPGYLPSESESVQVHT